MGDMSNKYHYYLSTFDNMNHNWELGLHYNDGSTVRHKFFDMSETQIVNTCREKLDEEFNLVRIFIWCGDRWWGEVCR